MSNEYKDWNREKNIELCQKYPFLIPRDMNGDMFINYDYDYILLDDMPIGWRYAFGEELCKDIKLTLLMCGGEEAVKNYHILQIKEKYGQLCWYDNSCNELISNLIKIAEEKSRETCIVCGDSAEFNKKRLMPICKKCYNKIFKEK